MLDLSQNFRVTMLSLNLKRVILDPLCAAMASWGSKNIYLSNACAMGWRNIGVLPSHGLGRLPSSFSYQVSSLTCRAFASALFVLTHHPLTKPVVSPPRWPRWSISALPIVIFLRDTRPAISMVKITISKTQPFSCSHSCQSDGMNQTLKL
jgi:hypothetical protein